MRKVAQFGFVVLQAAAIAIPQTAVSQTRDAQTSSVAEGKASADRPWGKYQVLLTPQARLTFLVQNAYLEKLERDLKSSPKLSRFLMESLSLPIEERLSAIREYRAWWTRADELWSTSPEHGRNEKSSVQVRTDYLTHAPKSPRVRYMKLMLEQGFHDFTLAGMRSIESLESEKNFEVRLVQLAAVLGHMVRDQDNLEVLASLSNFLLLIAHDKTVDAKVREKLLPHANELSKKVAKALRDAQGVDVLNPVNLVGGAVFFRGAIQVMAKASLGRALIAKWNGASTIAKAGAASVGGHAVVLAKTVESKPTLTEDQALVQAARERMQNPGDVLLKESSRFQAMSSESLSIDGLSAMAKSLVYAPYSSVEHAKKYAELIAYSERHIRASGKRYDQGFPASPADFLRLRDDITARFQRYMKKRGLNKVDDEAIAVLRGYISPYVAAHKDLQESVLLAIGSPGEGGNCVTRALLYTSIFYPLLVQYQNPDYRFGLMMWTDHVEPVLYLPKTDVALAISSLKVVEKPERPSLLEPRVLAASFLFRASSKTLHKEDASVVSNGLYSKAKMAIFKGPYFDLGLSSGRVESLRETDPNPSPLTTFVYSDRLKAAGALQRSMNSRPVGLNPLSEVSKVRDLLKTLGKDSAAPVEQILAPLRFDEGNPDPMQVALSTSESALASYSRKPTRFPLGFDGSAIVKFFFPGKEFLKLSRTPDRSRSDFELRLQRVLNESLNSDVWRRLKSADGLSLLDFRRDVDAQMSIIGFTEFVRELRELNRSDKKRGLSETFKMDLERYLETTGLAEDLAAAEANAKRALSKLTNDPSGRELVRYLEMANSMSSADKVRHVQALYGYVLLAGNAEEIKNQFWELELDVAEIKPVAEKAKEAKPALPTQLPPHSFGGGGKPVGITMVLANSQKPKPVKGTLDPEVAFLTLHYFSDVLSSRLGLVEKMVSVENKRVGSLKIMNFASKFFGWMPQIDSFGAWQGVRADRWVDMGQTSLCLAGRADQPVTARACEFLKKLDQELQFNEIEEDFKAPELGSNS